MGTRVSSVFSAPSEAKDVSSDVLRELAERLARLSLDQVVFVAGAVQGRHGGIAGDRHHS